MDVIAAQKLLYRKVHIEKRRHKVFGLFFILFFKSKIIYRVSLYSRLSEHRVAVVNVYAYTMSV